MKKKGLTAGVMKKAAAAFTAGVLVFTMLPSVAFADVSTAAAAEESTVVSAEESAAVSADENSVVSAGENTASSAEESTAVSAEGSAAATTKESAAVTTEESAAASAEGSTAVTADGSAAASAEESTAVTAAADTAASTNDTGSAEAYAALSENQDALAGSENSDSEWPSFRGNSTNNAVTAAKTPTSPDNAELYWAANAAVGSWPSTSPAILVDDCVVYCESSATGANIFKVNKVTGAIEAQAALYTGIGYSQIPPTYADGEIFVPLNNGCIQAVSASDLSSLWIYKDAVGGQPISPITYSNGKIYTGFWNGEQADANYVCITASDDDPSQTAEMKQASWTYLRKGGFYYAGSCVKDGCLLVPTDDGSDASSQTETSSVLALDPDTGSLIDSLDGLKGDIRTSIACDSTTGRCYFSSKGGVFYGFALNSDRTIDKTSVTTCNIGAASTSTPVIYNGRAYIGVSGGSWSKGQIDVIDLASDSVAYIIETAGNPQVSGLLTTGYEATDGSVYVYFQPNYNPGAIYVLKDKAGQTEADSRIIFTPTGKQANYCMCSLICDSDGTLYYNTDSGYMMAVGSAAKSLEITQQADKQCYFAGDALDLTGLKVSVTYANGTKRDVTDAVTSSVKNGDPLTAQDTSITLTFDHLLYKDEAVENADNKTGVAVAPLTVSFPITINSEAVSGGTYEIVSAANSNTALDIAGGSVKKGANVQLYTRNGTQAQAFTVVKNMDGTYKLLSYLSGRAVDVANASTASGANVQIYTDNASSAQKWNFIKNSDGTYTIENAASKNVLDISGGRFTPWTNIQSYASNGSAAQKFILVPSAYDASAKLDGDYTIVSSVDSSYGLDVTGASKQSGANVQLYKLNGTAAQIFRLIYTDGYYRILNMNSGKALDVSGGNAFNGNYVQQYNENGSDAQLFKLEQNADGSYTFISKLDSSYVLDLSAGKAENFRNIQIYKSNGSAAQHFFLK